MSAGRAVVIASLLLGAPSLQGADVSEPPSLQIEACALTLTPEGSRATLSDSALFAIASATDGSVSRLTLDRAPRTGWVFLAREPVEKCLRGWRLPPNSTYAVMLQFGTTGSLLSHWTLQVSTQGQGTLRVLLPRR